MGLVSDPAVLGLRFSPVAQYRPFAIVAPGFAQHETRDVGPVAATVRSEHRPVAPSAAVEAVVSEPSGGIALGLASGADEHLLATYDPVQRVAALEMRVDGRTRTLARRVVPVPAPFRMAFTLCENYTTMLVRHGDETWRPVVHQRVDVAERLDFREPDTLARFTYAWGPIHPDRPPTIGRLLAGPFGYTGIRDLHLVQHVDGRPYVQDGCAYLTATCAGTGFFPAAHWGVFTLDLSDPTRLEQVAQLYSHRDGLLLGDHAGQVVVDEDAGHCLVGVSSWGDFDTPSPHGVGVRRTTTSLEVLHGVHVLTTEPYELPTELSAWDPAMTRIGDRWHVGFVENPPQRGPLGFRPALAVGPPGADPFTGLTMIGSDTSVEQTEGPILQQVDGAWWLLASDGRNREYVVYDLRMRRRGSLDAPYGSNIPHPQLVPLPDGGWWLITFEGTAFAEEQLGYGGHGDVVVLGTG